MTTDETPPARREISRRQALLAEVLLGAAVSPLLCCSRAEPAPAASAPLPEAPSPPPPSAEPPPAASSASSLEVVALGPLRPDQTGGRLVVLLHGWGARGDDLVPLARRLGAPGMRFLVPAAPLPEGNGGRAWWSLDTKERPPHAWSDELPADHRPNREVKASREAVQSLLHDAQRRYAPESTALVGFSQGAMLALDVAIAGAPEVDRVAVLSGALLADTLPALRSRAPSAARPAVFVAHGTADSVVPFRGGQSIQSVLEPRGYPVTWRPFDGGHEIPSAVVAALRAFLA